MKTHITHLFWLLFFFFMPAGATLQAQYCIPENPALYKINMSGFTPNANFERQGDMLIGPTIIGAGGANFNNGINDREIGIVSGFPAGFPQAGALWFFSNTALCQYMNTGCNSIQANAALDITFTEIDENLGYLKFTLDGVIYDNVGAGNALVAELNTFTATNNFISGQIYQVIQGTIEVYFDNGGESVSGVIDIQGVNANSIGTSYMYCTFDGYCINGGCGCVPSSGGGNTPTCSGNTTLTNCSGSIEDGSGGGVYGNNQNCSWTIDPPGTSSVSLQFTTFNTEEGYDEVTVYNGYPGSGTLLGTFSGAALPNQVLTANSGVMTVEFTSDGSVQEAGWSANYWCNSVSTCSGLTTLNACSGTFSDGSGSDPYNNNLNCKWLINPSGATSISLSFQSFDTEAGYDQVRVYNGTNSSAPLIGVFSGNNLPHRLNANSGKMYIEFITDVSITKPGWLASYSCNSTAIPASFCNNTTTLTNCTGTIQDGSGNNNYVINQDCSWLIQPPGATSVTLTFSSFDTELNYDFVEIYNGSNISAPRLGVFSGATLPPTLTANSGKMFIRFFTDFSANGTGWSANYTCGGLTPCNTPINVQIPDPPKYSYFRLKCDNVSNATGYKMRMRPANGTWQEFNVNSASAGFYNRLPNTTYECQMKTRCALGQESNWSTSVFATTLGASEPYCFSYGDSRYYWIKRVQVAEIDNSTQNDRGYWNYTEKQASLITGQPYSFTLEGGTTTSPDTLLNWKIWIDLNKNNNFDDSGELIWQGSGNMSQPIAGTINLPSNTPIGLTRMRVSMSTSSINNPCQTGSWRDVEDYGVLITNLMAPTAAFTESNTCTSTGNTVSFVSQSSGADSYNWSFPSGTPATSTVASPTVIYNTPGIYSVNLTVSNAAGSNSIQKSNLITVYNPVQIVPATTNPVLCEGEDVPLQVLGGATGMNFTWTGNGLSNNQGSSTTALLTNSGIYTYQVTGFLNNCTTTDDLTLSVTPNDSVELDLIVTGCPGPNITFSASITPNLTIVPQWFVNGGAVTQGNTFSSNTLLNGNQVFFTIPTDNLPDCVVANTSQSEIYMVSCLQVPPIAAFTESSTCASTGNTVSFVSQSSGADSYNWSFPGGTPATSTLASPTVTYNTPGIYTVNLTVSNTAGSNSIQKSNLITVYNPVQIVPVTTDSILCVGQSVPFQVVGGAIGMNYFWNGSGLSSTQGASIIASLQNPGLNTYQVTGFLNNCTTMDDLNLSVTSTDSVTLDIVVTGCPGPNLTFTANVAPALTTIPQWFVNGGLVAQGSIFSTTNLVNGNQVYFTIPINDLPDCVVAPSNQSELYNVTCLTPSSVNSEQANTTFKVVPNPNKGDFRVLIQAQKSETGRLCLYNSLGICVYKSTLSIVSGETLAQVDLQRFPDGCYFLTLELSDSFIQEKVIIQK
jgi:PKD repeat protein